MGNNDFCMGVGAFLGVGVRFVFLCFQISCLLLFFFLSPWLSEHIFSYHDDWGLGLDILLSRRRLLSLGFISHEMHKGWCVD